MQISIKGVIALILSNIIFALLYLYSTFMKPMVGTDVFAWRMCSMLLTLFVMLFVIREWRKSYIFFLQMNKKKSQWLLFIFSTAMLAYNLWLFMWGPVNGEGINVAMGYFLFPLVLLFIGIIFFGERLNRLQQAAVLFAAIGVGHELWVTHTFSLITLSVAISFPLYYCIRRILKAPALGGLFIDLLLITPFALIYLIFYSDSFSIVKAEPIYWLLILVLGLLSGLSMYFNVYSNRLLPIKLFSILSYLEPILLFAVAILFLGNQLTESALLTYGFIWLGLMFMIADSYIKLREQKTINNNLEKNQELQI